MENLKLIRPNKEYERQAKEYIQEFIDYKSEVNGSGGLNRYVDNYDLWLERNEMYRKGLIPDRVPAETFMLIREEDNKLIGMINIRLKLDEELLIHGGHIGYGVRPTERRKGYNSYQLYLALKFCDEQGLDKVLLTCFKDNLGSAKTIQNSCGVLENEIVYKDKVFQRYWIDVKEAIEKGSKKYEKKKVK